MSLATAARPSPRLILRSHPWILLWPVTALLLAAITGASPMYRTLPRLQAVGLTAAEWIVLGLVLWLVHRLTEGGAAKADEPVRRPWLALLAPLLPWFVRNMAVGRIVIPGTGWLGSAYGALLQAISGPISRLAPDWMAYKVGLAAQNGLTHILFPILLSLLLGVRLRAHGLTWRSFWVGWVLAIPLILVNLLEWFTRPGTFRTDLLTLATNPFVNGYGEQLLFNGLILPRLIQLTRSPAVGISLNALFFGLIHYWTNRPNFPDAWGALATCIIVQAPTGLLLGYLAYRLRSLLAGSILHVWLDT